MILTLVRHGIAIERDDPKCPPEPERFLTDRGREKSVQAAAGFAELGIEVDVWLSSPYVRARQTAEIFARALKVPIEGMGLTESLLPEADPSLLADELRGIGTTASVIAFGHAPNLDRVVGHLLGVGTAVTALKKSGAACVEIETLGPPRACLLWVLTPAQLRQMG